MNQAKPVKSMDVDMATQPKQKFGDFSDMNKLLTQIDNKMEKQLKHEARVKQLQKARSNEADALDLEKERLLKIAKLSVFS